MISLRINMIELEMHSTDTLTSSKWVSFFPLNVCFDMLGVPYYCSTMIIFFKKCVILSPHIIKRVYKGFIWKAEGELQALHTLQKMKYKALKIDIYFNN